MDGESVTGERVRAELVQFVRALRGAGANVPANAAYPAAEALLEVGLLDRDRVRAALRASLVSEPRDLDLFDRLFPQFWQRLSMAVEDDEPGDEEAEASSMEPLSVASEESETREHEDGEPPDPAAGRVNVSREGGAEQVESSRLTLGEYSRVGRSEQVAGTVGYAPGPSVDGAVRRLTSALASTDGRRWTSTASGSRVDLRRALRQAQGGAALPLPEQEQAGASVRGVVLVDVSQSVLDTVEPDFLLRFLDALYAQWRRLRVFFFDTNVQEVTDAFATADGDVYGALERAQAQWGGGTRIGETLSTVRREHPHAVDRNTVVLVVSDGLDRGDVDVLTDGMAWLSARAPLVLWLNPLAVSPEFEPATRGMSAALPYVDGLFAFADASDVDEVARQLERQDPPEIGYEYDTRRR